MPTTQTGQQGSLEGLRYGSAMCRKALRAPSLFPPFLASSHAVEVTAVPLGALGMLHALLRTPNLSTLSWQLFVSLLRACSLAHLLDVLKEN